MEPATSAAWLTPSPGWAIDRLVTDSVFEVLKADAVFLPGVGAAGDTMKGLEAIGMADAVKKLVAWRRPLFAICVGLQVLLSSTEEGGHHPVHGHHTR